jgi:hypothetical protein
LPHWRSAVARPWLARASAALVGFSSPARLVLLLAQAQAQLEGLSAPRCGDEMFWLGLACMIWVVLDF